MLTGPHLDRLNDGGRRQVDAFIRITHMDCEAAELLTSEEERRGEHLHAGQVIRGTQRAWSRVRKTDLRDSRYAPVRKSCVADTTMVPLRGVTRLEQTPRSVSDSARA